MSLLLATIGLFVLPDPWRFIAFGAALTLEAGEIYVGLRIINRWPIKSGAEAMIGETAEVITRCDPEGQVRINGEIWRAHSVAPVTPGTTVRVREIEGLTLLVHTERDDAETHRAG